MRKIFFIATVVFCGLVHVNGDCPHERNGLKSWSDANTWTTDNNPNNGGDVTITEPVIVDAKSASLANVIIQDGGMLTFSPEVDIDFRAANIYIYDQGALEIGSEDCAYTGKLTITLTGNREDHDGETHPKAILVDAGGTLEIHGEPRLAWTKITETLNKANPSENDDIYFEHSESDYSKNESMYNGIHAYTFSVDDSNKPVVKAHGEYDLVWKNDDFVNQINSLEDGDILMIASQKTIRRKEGDEDRIDSFDALETLVFGEVTGDLLLRNVQTDGSTYAFVYQKGNEDSYQEVTNPMGTTSMARLVLSEDLIFTAWTVGGRKTWMQEENFRVSNRNGVQPKVTLLDDASSWRPGDVVVFASTDYDYQQAEEREVVRCLDCQNNEIRISAYPDYMHFGEVLHGALDMRGEVMLKTRKIVIKGEMEAECPEFNGNCDQSKVYGLDTFGAHIKILKGYANVHLEHFELFHAGQQTDAGRYPIHFHMCFDKIESATKPYIRGVSIHDTFARCVTIHGSHGIEVIDSTCYNAMGHGFFLEDGGELHNTFDGNLALSTRYATGTLEPLDASAPTSFWITNPNTVVRNNVAGGGDGMGFWFLYPEEPLPPSREYNLMDKFEAQRTMIKEFDNNVGHSNNNFGIKIGNLLMDDRTIKAANDWQPLVDPKDPNTDPIEINISKITAYKNRRNNVWIEGGFLNVEKISVADGANGIVVTNEGQQFQKAGRLGYSVVIGDSENKGEPDEGMDRSLAFPWTPDMVRSGIAMWKGPTRFDHIWFDGFQANDVYDNAAIAKKRRSPYFFSVTTPFRNIDFAFDDMSGGNIAISGVEGVDKGWDNKDGELISGFTWYTEDQTYYVVKPDALSAAAADCQLRENWRLAICKTKYGNMRIQGRFNKHSAIFVRDDLPSAQLEFKLQMSTGPQVVLDGSRTYTVHYPDEGPEATQVIAEGMETGDTLRVGVCLPLNAEFDIRSLYPTRMTRREFFVQVDSLADLDKTDADDGKKFYHDAATGMVYYKFIGATTRSLNESASCGGGQCPEFRVTVLNGSISDMDCRARLYTATQLAMTQPALPVFSDVIPAGAAHPPSGYGAGLTRPFTNRAVVDGGYGEWSEWTTCSKTCDEGVSYRRRACNNPAPANGGKMCEGDSQESQPCTLEPCAIDGAFSQWTEWAACTRYDANYCAGASVRTRSCSEPAAQYGGVYCEGSAQEFKPCDTCSVTIQ